MLNPQTVAIPIEIAQLTLVFFARQKCSCRDCSFNRSQRRVVLADFGISKQFGEKDVSSSKAGSCHYYAPELLQSGSYSHKSDMWSLGCLIPELVSNGQRNPVFDSEQAIMEYSNGVIEHPPQVEKNDNLDLDSVDIETLNGLIARLLSRDPGDRFSAKELRLELSALMQEGDAKTLWTPNTTACTTVE